MKTNDAKRLLATHSDRPAVFVSDPTAGDSITILSAGTPADDTAGSLLANLDFETYEGDGPDVTFQD